MLLLLTKPAVPPRMFPLAGVPQTYPLKGVSQQYPLTK